MPSNNLASRRSTDLVPTRPAATRTIDAMTFRLDAQHSVHPARRPASGAGGFYVLGALLIVMLTATAGCGWRATSPVCLAGAHLDALDRCRAQRAPVHRIPFRAGVETKVMQAYHGYRTHKKDLAYSIDFKCEPGTPIVASRTGVVWHTREDSNTGCDDPSCVDDGNFVILDHGDGTFSEYHHLQQFGALVETGETVCAGQVIGLCGNTGYSSGPHLHFAVTDTSHRTVPARFHRDQGAAFPFVVPEQTYTSKNEMQTTCRAVEPSELPEHAFAHQGIVLDQGIPLVVERGGPPHRLSGRYFGPHPNVAVHRKPVDGGEWVDECIPVGANGRFSASLRWPKPGDGKKSKKGIDAGYYWFMITAGNAECLSPGWAWSYKVRVD